MVRFGTKCPSITSRWIRSAPPRSTRGHLRAKRREIGRQDRRREAHAHRLTSSAIASPGATWNPPAGVWRMHDAGWHARVGLRADEGDAEAALAEATPPRDRRRRR